MFWGSISLLFFAYPRWLSALNGWLPDLLFWSFVLLIVLRINGIKSTKSVRRLASLLFHREGEDRETIEARARLARLKELQPRDERKGFSRVWASFLLAVLVGSWLLWASTVVADHQKILAAQKQALESQKEVAALKLELSKYEKPLTNIHTWFNVQVISKTDRTHYMVHVEGRQKREAFFFCEDSRQDVDWDPGMRIESVTFEMRDGCKSIHAESLGFYVDRDARTLKFIHFAKEYE